MPRYAIFYAPRPDDPLNEAASQWLGRDAFSGAHVERASPVEGMCLADFDKLTTSARRYGFHGTLKAPFELAQGYTIEALEDALEAFCASVSCFTLPAFKVGQLGPFFALLPSTASKELADLAANLVRDFDAFRAPLSEADIARRKPERLSQSQRDNLIEWGYPYIFDEFRFHMTLSDPIPDDLTTAFQSALEHHFAPHLAEPKLLSGLSLFVEPERGAPFTVRRQFSLA